MCKKCKNTIAELKKLQKPFKKGFEINFLNRPTSISPISVQIALKQNVPVVIAKTLIRNGRTEISFRRISIQPDIRTSNADTVQYGLQQVMNQISQDIVDDPEQWAMWSHDFWRKPRKATCCLLYTSDAADE